MLKQFYPIAIILTCVISMPAMAIVNVEDLRTEKKSDGWNGSINLALSGASGNTDKSVVSAGGAVQLHKGRMTNMAIVNYAYGESNGTRDTNKAFLHIRHIKEIHPKRALEAFAQIEENEFTRLSLRELIGAGMRLSLHDIPDGRTHLGIGAFYVRETLDQRVGLSDDGTEYYWRGNFYLTVRYPFNKQSRLVSTTYYQPNVNQLDDYRILEDAGLKIKLAEQLDLKISLEITHDNRPPQGIEKTDTNYLTGIEYLF